MEVPAVCVTSTSGPASLSVRPLPVSPTRMSGALTPWFELVELEVALSSEAVPADERAGVINSVGCVGIEKRSTLPGAGARVCPAAFFLEARTALGVLIARFGLDAGVDGADTGANEDADGAAGCSAVDAERRAVFAAAGPEADSWLVAGNEDLNAMPWPCLGKRAAGAERAAEVVLCAAEVVYVGPSGTATARAATAVATSRSLPRQRFWRRTSVSSENERLRAAMHELARATGDVAVVAGSSNAASVLVVGAGGAAGSCVAGCVLATVLTGVAGPGAAGGGEEDIAVVEEDDAEGCLAVRVLGRPKRSERPLRPSGGGDVFSA
jgi:hypothetical protein